MGEEIKIPEGAVLRDDGCICPPEKKAPAVKFNKLITCGYDPRFPNSNQTRRCFMSFVDYQRCARLLGDYPGCKYFLICYKTLCPNEWIEKWFTQMENSLFPRKIYPPKPIIRSTEPGIVDYEDDEPPVDTC